MPASLPTAATVDQSGCGVLVAPFATTATEPPPPVPERGLYHAGHDARLHCNSASLFQPSPFFLKKLNSTLEMSIQ